jgi:hypothetical protein
MGIVGGAARVITQTADAVTAAAGAVSGAAINGVIGGVQGTASGIRNGLSRGSRSTPAAALTVGVLGAAGIVEWPLLLTIGGTALVVHQLSRRSEGQSLPVAPTPLRAVADGAAPRKSAARKSAARKSAARKSSATARSTQPRKSTTGRRRTSSRTS